MARQRTSAHNNKTTLAIVDKLILWTIQTCLLNGLLSVLTLAFFIALPGKFAWLATYIALPKVFSNSFLVNLNSRVKLRHLQEDGGLVEMPVFSSDNNRNTVSFPHRLGARITVTKEETMATDLKEGPGELAFHFENGGSDTLRSAAPEGVNEYELKREPLGLDVVDILRA
ncbi:hypothetical protein V5O48_014072 [Marasmius crinis-equi]|uniref:DUF6534 domain-containing protein n=1 Tax=Marasmius crinis-equi TaxID=585013 RepID=A0ABR3EYC1_9AGAR